MSQSLCPPTATYESILPQRKHQNLGTGLESIGLMGTSVYPLGMDTHFAGFKGIPRYFYF